MTFAGVGLLVQHSYSEFCIRFTGQGPSSLVRDGGASDVTGVRSVTLDIMGAQACVAVLSRSRHSISLFSL